LDSTGWWTARSTTEAGTDRAYRSILMDSPSASVSNDDRDAFTISTDRELVAVYGELRKIAQSLLAHERTGVSIQATSLVHEAYARLHGQQGGWVDERHYFNTAVRAMRRYLIDRARERAAIRHGGDRNRIPLVDQNGRPNPALELPMLREIPEDEIADLGPVLAELEQSMPRCAEVTELRWLAGLTIEQVATVLEISEDTVKREWRFGRAWLRRKLLGKSSSEPFG